VTFQKSRPFPLWLLADRKWLDEATKTIGQYWRRKNARRNGLTLENQADAALVDSLAPFKNLQRTSL
jgi:hypothetical protein